MIIIKAVIIYFTYMTKLSAVCPVCDAKISLSDGLEESEIINCSDCRSRLVVEKITGEEVVLNKAPEVEEDWGE